MSGGGGLTLDAGAPGRPGIGIGAVTCWGGSDGPRSGWDIGPGVDAFTLDERAKLLPTEEGGGGTTPGRSV